MTSRLCLAAHHPWTPYRGRAWQMCKPHPPHASSSLGVLRFQVYEAVGASVDEGGGRLAGYLTKRVKDGVDEEGLLRGSEETARPAVRIQDLRIGSISKGKVSVIHSYGVFVDIGASTDGFVHISRLGRSYVRRVEDVVQVGQEVSVQIVDLDLHTNRISLLLAPEEGFNESVGLRAFTLSEREVANRAAAMRTNKLSRRAGNPLPRRRMSLETRQRLKAYRRAVLAERQAIQLHQAGSRNANDLNGFSSLQKSSPS